LQSVETTQRFERNLLALQQVFEEVTPQIRAFSREVENYGLSQSQAAQASVFLGSVLKQYGFSTQKSADETERLVALAQDLATTFGYDVQEALLAITALFRGEFDPIEKFGVAMKQSEINARMAADGLGNLEGEAFNLASAQTRLTMLFERANDSVGAYGRATNTLYAAQQQLAAVTQNMQVAFGSNLQEPIAAVINQFTAFAKEFGPDVVDIGNELGNAIDDLAPLFGELSKTFFLLLAPLESVVRLLGLVGRVVTAVLTPAFALLNYGLDRFNTLLNFLVIQTDMFDASLRKVGVSGDGFIDFLNEVLHLDRTVEFFNSLPNTIDDTSKAMQKFVDFTRNNKYTEASRDAGMLAGAIRNTSNEAEEAIAPLTYFETALRKLGVFSRDAESELSGLALIFDEIDTAARKSEASGALEDIGFSAGQIEQIVTRPDWELIFGQISSLAKAAAIDVARATTLGIVNAALAQKALDELMKGLFTDKGTGGAAATNYVKEFYTKLDEEVSKQNARRRLMAMGASEGLVESIVGAQGWEKVFDRILRGGDRALTSLQRRFNRTAVGAQELQDAIDANAKALEELREENKKAEQESADFYAGLKAKAQDYIDSIEKISSINILPNVQQEVGRFESALVGSFNSIRSTLETGLANQNIYRHAYNELLDYANREQAVLQNLARQRDDIANRLNLATALISEYRSVFTSALGLSRLLDNMQSNVTERTVEQVTTGIVSLEGGLRLLNVSIKKTFVETITDSQSQTGQLIDNFEQIRKKAVAFANNLRELRDMGLNPMLFDQLVRAGMEAGGKTAQALVDGGLDAVDALNETYAELDAVGASLGESVAQTLYGSGLDMAQGIIDGLTNRENELYALAAKMAQTFADSFRGAVGEAAGEVVQGAANLAALQAQLDSLTNKLEFAQMRLGQEQDNLSVAVASGRREAIEKKIAAYSQQIKDFSDAIASIIAQMGNVPQFAEGGIVNGATFAMVGEAGPEAIIPLDRLGDMMVGSGGGTQNIYNINVSVDATKSPAQVGQTIAEAINNFSNKGGKLKANLASISSR
jgi:hypothetical protein